MQLFLVFALTLGWSLVVHGYKLTFHESPTCRGAELGTLDIHLGNVCHRKFAHEAKSVLVRKQEKDPQDTAVGFFGDPNCDPDHVGAETNNGCVELSKHFASFAVSYVSDGLNTTSTGNDDDEASGDESYGHNLRPHTDDKNAPSIPSRDADRFEEDGYFHGAVMEIFGETIKLHQVAHGVFVGILKDQWDEDINVRNDDILSSNLSSTSISNELSEYSILGSKLGGPDDLQGRCRAGIVCSREFLKKSTRFLLYNVIGTAVHRIYVALESEYSKRPDGETFVEYLSRKIITTTFNAGASIGYGSVSIRITPVAPITPQEVVYIQDCTNTKTVTATVTETVQVALRTGDAYDDNVAVCRLTLGNGQNILISAEAVPLGERSNGECGVEPRRFSKLHSHFRRFSNA